MFGTMHTMEEQFETPVGIRNELSAALESLNTLEALIAAAAQDDCNSDLMERLQLDLLDMKRENDILRRSLEASSIDNHKLRSENERLKSNGSNEDVHQACKDKIAALRSVARALESENELLSNEKASFEKSRQNNATARHLELELRTKGNLVNELQERLERLQSEKINVMRQLVSLEQDLDAVRNAKTDLESQLADAYDANEAMRHGKRVVEARMQAVAAENGTLTQEMEKLQQEKTNLESELALTVKESADRAENVSALEQEFALQSSLFESKIASMQGELDTRLDEITLSKNDDVETVKTHYITLFDEKATELHNLRSDFETQTKELEKSRRLLADFQYQENEWKEQMKRERQCHHEKYEETLSHLAKELDLFKSQNYVEIENELQKLRNQYDNLQLSYLNAIAQFKTASVTRDSSSLESSTVTAVSSDRTASSCGSSGGDDSGIKSMAEHQPQNVPKKKRHRKKKR